MIFDYATGSDLAQFTALYEDTANSVNSIDIIPVAQALEEAGTAGTIFIKTADGKTASTDEIAKKTDYHVVAVDGGPVKIQTEGKIMYTSDGVKLNSSLHSRDPGRKELHHIQIKYPDADGIKEERFEDMEKTMEKIVALAKSRGFVYPGSEIYGGLANTWDYGNLGVELKNNVKKAWWQKFVQESPYNVGVDCAILMNSQTWVASGHLGGFSDPLMDCKACKERFRADKLIEDYMAEHGITIEGSVDAWSQEEMKKYIDDNNICCPSRGQA